MEARVDITEVYNGLEKFNILTRKKIKNYMEDQAEELEDYMKTHAKWNDRTGNARRNLSATVEESFDAIRIALAHGVDYGFWLEYAMRMNYAILEPTARLKGPEVINGMHGLLNRR